MQTPVVMMLFNRPHLTRRNLDALRRVQPDQLFVVADGPRPGNPDDERLCAEVRKVIGEVDWRCDVRTRFAEFNLGLDPNIESGIDWVFSQVDRAIFLEDDCIADPTFFRYCTELLDRYADEPRVWQIVGEPHTVPESVFGDLSYDFSGWASIWGWATWADRWHRHRSNFDRDHTGRGPGAPLTPPHWRVPALPDPDAIATKAGMKHFTMTAENPDPSLFFWDHAWWNTILSENGLSAVPRHNLVENDGFGEDASNTKTTRKPIPARPMDFPMTHPPELRQNRELEAGLELVLVRVDGTLARLAHRLIRPMWMRTIVRRIITHRWVEPLVHRILGR